MDFYERMNNRIKYKPQRDHEDILEDTFLHGKYDDKQSSQKHKDLGNHQSILDCNIYHRFPFFHILVYKLENDESSEVSRGSNHFMLGIYLFICNMLSVVGLI